MPMIGVHSDNHLQNLRMLHSHIAMKRQLPVGVIMFITVTHLTIHNKDAFPSTHKDDKISKHACHGLKTEWNHQKCLAEDAHHSSPPTLTLHAAQCCSYPHPVWGVYKISEI